MIGRKNRTALYGLCGCIFFMLAAVSALEAQNLYLEWKAVEGAGGYRVEIQSSDGRPIFDRELEATRIEFTLPPGSYRKRIGAIDRFGKIAAWSDWSPLFIKLPEEPQIDAVIPAGLGKNKAETIQLRGRNLSDSTEVRLEGGGLSIPGSVKLRGKDQIAVTFDTSGLPVGPYSLQVQNKNLRGQPREVTLSEKSSSRASLSLLVPGASQLQAGSTTRALLWGGLFTGLVAGSISESYQAATVAAATRRDLTVNLIASPSTLLIARDRLDLDNQGAMTLALLGYNNYRSYKNRYDQHLLNAAVLGGAAGLVYTLQYADAIDWQWLELLPGLPQMERGSSARAAFFWTGFGTLLFAAGREAQSASAAVRSQRSEVIPSLLSDPGRTLVLLSTFPAQERGRLLMLSYHESRKLEARYNRNITNMSAFGSGALALFAIHLVDNAAAYTAFTRVRPSEQDVIGEVGLTLAY
ncbi:MAG: hypothetical protein HS115_10780 [Spirochaetales bacterium]|nr:hypothetical protein [Spirochaetales bacterium]